jgi:hypothetical protein
MAGYRLLGFLGTFLVGWTVLFELGGPDLASWNGETLSERTHLIVFSVPISAWNF